LAITIGTQLGAHEITALLGKGGMGEVYRARDTKLKREVAIKILPDEFSRDTDRLNRFQREAEVLASLNHPNIAAIYDFQEANDTRFLVMELVEGETLADRIARGPISVEEALEIGKHICEALEAAHEKGIVHRDLKPSNVKVTPDGKVKVLDFGLAKAMENSPANVTLSNSPTMLSGAMGGVIVGTAGYMSPEQAKGRAADQRSDVFAFGCVLYEMLSGRQPFQGEDVSDILAAVLKTEPAFEALPLDTPAPIQKLIRRCLEKDPRRRIPHIAVARFALEDELQSPSKPESVTTLHPAHKRLRIALVIAALFLVLSVAVGVMNFLYRGLPSAASIRFQFDAPPGGVFGNTVEPGRGANPPAPNFAISPDGTRLAYVLTSDGKARLWVRRLDTLTGQPLPGTESASFPFWSPDGRFIAFFAAGKLKRIAVSGGPPQIICDAKAGEGGAWNVSGRGPVGSPIIR
jgi:serine/threonine protein kinase